jgi:excisionase family DNA binding protein
MKSPEPKLAPSLLPELYRIRDVAALLSVSQRMVYNWIEQGHFAVVHLPGTGRRPAVRISRADLLAFIQRQRTETEP